MCSLATRSRPAGTPSTIMVREGPWDSPAERYLSIHRSVARAISPVPHGAAASLGRQARTPPERYRRGPWRRFSCSRSRRAGQLLDDVGGDDQEQLARGLLGLRGAEELADDRDRPDDGQAPLGDDDL